MYEESAQVGQILPKTAPEHCSTHSLVSIHEGRSGAVPCSPLRHGQAAFVPTEHPASPCALAPAELRRLKPDTKEC